MSAWPTKVQNGPRLNTFDDPLVLGLRIGFDMP
jgi:hypothetical protein